MAELLTPSIAYAYNQKAKALPYNGMQDIGERRRLRQDLQERCGITELEAINILNGFHIDTYCIKYLRKAARQQREHRSRQRKGAGDRRKMKPKKFYIIRPEIEIEYIKNPILGRLYIMLNYWRFIKAGYYWIFTYKVYYIAFPRIYRKAENE